MGSLIRPFLIAAPLLIAAPVLAQQGEQTTPGLSLPPTGATPPPDTNRQGPELNVYRDLPAQGATPPPVAAPTVVVPPVAVQPSVATPPATRTAPATSLAPREKAAPAPTPDRLPAGRETRPAPAPQPPVETPPPPPPSAAAPASTPAPAEPAPNASAPAPTPAAVPSVEDQRSPIPWIVGLILLGGAVAAFLVSTRRRRHARSLTTPPPVERPADTAQPKAPAPAAPRPSPLPEPVAADPDRPWIAMDLGVAQARFSLIGVTIAYSLHLTNRGASAAQDVMVRGIIGNAGARQQALLQGFLAGQDGLPLHSAVAIAPGETLTLTGELRLGPDRIEPVTMGARSLLIPLAAFDAAYKWDAGEGRTARAFIVGQEQDPPAERLAPLRLDQGPRQYRRPAARAAAELTPA